MGSRPVSSTGQALRGNDGGGAGLAPGGVAALDAGALGYEVGDEVGGDHVQLISGIEPVAGVEVFELAIDDVAVEADDGAPVVGLLSDDVCQGGWSLCSAFSCWAVLANRGAIMRGGGGVVAGMTVGSRAGGGFPPPRE